VRFFGCKSRTHRTLGRHQIRVFHHWSEQLVSWEARTEDKEALAHVLGAEASPEAAPTVDKHRPCHLTVVGLRCRSPPFMVSINTFPSSLRSSRSKPYWKSTNVAWENSNSGEPSRSAATCRREHEPTPPPAGASRLNRQIGAWWLLHRLWRADGNPVSDRLRRADGNPALDRIQTPKQRYRFYWFNPSCRSGSQQPAFNEVDRPCEPALVDPIHGAVDIFYGFI
jgi:hypothetical protein